MIEPSIRGSSCLSLAGGRWQHGICGKDAYAFVLGSALSEQEQKLLAASFSAARKTANSWKAVDQQLTHAECDPCSVDPKRYASLKPLVRRGIPFELRPTLWHRISGAAAKQAAAGQAYQDLAASALATLPKDTLMTLAEDLGAGCFAFRSHPAFRSRRGEGLEALRRVMAAYLGRNPGGYFRGLAHVCGFVLVVMGLGREEQAFWVVAALMEDKLFGYCEAQASYGLKVEGAVVQALVGRKLPKVAAHLAKLGTSPAALVGPWLSSLLTTLLPSEVTARVFDCLLLEGNKVLLRTSLALLKAFEPTILASSHPSQLRKVLDTRLARLYDGEALMGLAFRGIGAMQGSAIAVQRSAAAAAVDEQLAQHTARLEMILCRTH